MSEKKPCSNPLCPSHVKNPPTSYTFLPDEIDIMGHTWKIRDMIPAAVQMATSASGFTYEGACDAAIQEISILPGLPEDKVMECLIHEIIEAINDMMTLDMEHSVIQNLSLALFQVFYTNGFLDMEDIKNVWGKAELIIKDSLLLDKTAKPPAHDLVCEKEELPKETGNLDAEFRKNYPGNIKANAPGLACYEKKKPTQLPMR
jgi:hypothetical protein